MNKIVKMSLGLVCALGLTACVQDLNQTPIDKNSAVSFNQDAVFSKCYSMLATTGQTGPAGDGDVDGLDEGTSAFYRLMWELNEFCSDEGWWIWNDVGLADIRIMNWNGENDLVKGLYYRFIIDIKVCNHFLSMTKDLNDDKTKQQRAEVRFIRALNYWYLLDLFKFAPFTIEDSSDAPTFYNRTQLFNWLTGELKDLTDLLPASRLSKYRVDQAAAWLLLARTYLNAEVYTGTAMWDEAERAAVKAQSYQYSLYTTPTVSASGVTYSAYQKLFMADNDINGAQNEAVLMIYQDGKYCQSYGGTQFVIAATRDAGMVPWGVSTQWKCFRSSRELILKFTDEATASAAKADEYQMPALLKDDRAIFCSATDSTTNVWTFGDGKQDADFYSCWACCKFSGVYSSAEHPSKSVGSTADWADTDIPLMRIAEAHMIQAEALYRQGEKEEALMIINQRIRKRANADPLPTLTDRELCDEWAREFWCEGRRRTDLIRFGLFAGPKATANAYQWEGRNGKASGDNNFTPNDEKWNWYPIPSDDKKSNPNFKTVVLGDSENEYANQGGDGYVYAN